MTNPIGQATGRAAYRHYFFNNLQMSKSMEKISSGLRINSAADGAAELSVSEKLRAQASGLSVAIQNSQNAISLLQTAEGGLNEAHAIVQRMYSLTARASQDTINDSQREAFQSEINDISTELTRIFKSTQYNGMNLFSGKLGAKALLSGDLENVVESIKVNSNIEELGEYSLTVNQTSQKAKGFILGGVQPESEAIIDPSEKGSFADFLNASSAGKVGFLVETDGKSAYIEVDYDPAGDKTINQVTSEITQKLREAGINAGVAFENQKPGSQVSVSTVSYGEDIKNTVGDGTVESLFNVQPYFEPVNRNTTANTAYYIEFTGTNTFRLRGNATTAWVNGLSTGQDISYDGNNGLKFNLKAGDYKAGDLITFSATRERRSITGITNNGAELAVYTAVPNNSTITGSGHTMNVAERSDNKLDITLDGNYLGSYSAGSPYLTNGTDVMRVSIPSVYNTDTTNFTVSTITNADIDSINTSASSTPLFSFDSYSVSNENKSSFYTFTYDETLDSGNGGYIVTDENGANAFEAYIGVNASSPDGKFNFRIADPIDVPVNGDKIVVNMKSAVKQASLSSNNGDVSAIQIPEFSGLANGTYSVSVKEEAGNKATVQFDGGTAVSINADSSSFTQVTKGGESILVSLADNIYDSTSMTFNVTQVSTASINSINTVQASPVLTATGQLNGVNNFKESETFDFIYSVDNDGNDVWTVTGDKSGAQSSVAVSGSTFTTTDANGMETSGLQVTIDNATARYAQLGFSSSGQAPRIQVDVTIDRPKIIISADDAGSAHEIKIQSWFNSDTGVLDSVSSDQYVRGARVYDFGLNTTVFQGPATLEYGGLNFKYDETGVANLGMFYIEDGGGNVHEIQLQQSDNIRTVIDRINSVSPNVSSYFDLAEKRIIIEDRSGGNRDIRVYSADGSSITENLGIAGTGKNVIEGIKLSRTRDASGYIENSDGTQTFISAKYSTKDSGFSSSTLNGSMKGLDITLNEKNIENGKKYVFQVVAEGLGFFVSANGGVNSRIVSDIGEFTVEDLFDGHTIDVTTTKKAQELMDAGVFQNAVNKLSIARGELGVQSNRISHTLKSLEVAKENMVSAESKIRDTDISTEMLKFATDKLRSQGAINAMKNSRDLGYKLLDFI